MIAFVATASASLHDADVSPADRAGRVVDYRPLLHSRSASTGTYAFSDLERLTQVRREMAAAVHAQLESAGAIILNHPARSRLRYELLRELCERDINSFGVYRLTEAAILFGSPCSCVRSACIQTHAAAGHSGGASRRDRRNRHPRDKPRRRPNNGIL